MERTLIFICVMLLVSCSGLEKPEMKDDDESVEKTKENKSNVYCGNMEDTRSNRRKLNAVEVNWMYMDDSLKNLCRPLSFRLPLMKSNITTLPEMPGIEIARLPVFKNFETDYTARGETNDTTFYYFVSMGLGNCKCKVTRFYFGDSSKKYFEGYSVIEQVICNAYGVDPEITDLKLHPTVEEEENDSTYDVHGHDH